MRPRDSQRSRVYAWERAAVQEAKLDFHEPDIEAVDECRNRAVPIWTSERGRYGLQNIPVPAIERPQMGQRAAIAHPDHRITHPCSARSRWVILH